MKRLFVLLSPVALLVLGGCVAVPYETDTVYYSAYPSTITAQASGSYGYYYPNQTYPYAVPRYGQTYPYYPNPYYRPPAYTPPAPIIVPPPMEFRYEGDRRPGHNAPQRDQFRNGSRPDWNRRNSPAPSWEYRDDGRRDWQWRDGQRRDWHPHDNHGNDWPDGRPNPWQQQIPQGRSLQR